MKIFLYKKICSTFSCSNLHWSHSPGLFYRVLLKGDPQNWDWRLRLNATLNAIHVGCSWWMAAGRVCKTSKTSSIAFTTVLVLVLFVTVCCSALQCVAVCCGEFWCVAVRCSVLQCGLSPIEVQRGELPHTALHTAQTVGWVKFMIQHTHTHTGGPTESYWKCLDPRWGCGILKSPSPTAWEYVGIQQCSDISFISRMNIWWNTLWTELHWKVSWGSKRTKKTCFGHFHPNSFILLCR